MNSISFLVSKSPLDVCQGFCYSEADVQNLDCTRGQLYIYKQTLVSLLFPLLYNAYIYLEKVKIVYL